jgi:hypothetical protein
MKLRRLNNALHRDIGYFFFGMAIIYGLSGIALNHRHHWNPNYIIKQEVKTISVPTELSDGKALSEAILKAIGDDFTYKTHLEAGNNLRIFVDGGTINVNMVTGNTSIETVKRRPVFNEVNFLHYNTPRKLWTWFSDLFALGLIVLAITGLFVLKGKNGLKRRGVYFVVTGILIPLLLLYLYMST